MGNPQQVMAATRRLPPILTQVINDIPTQYAAGTLCEYVSGLDAEFHSCTDHLTGMELLLAKCTVFTLAQAYIDCRRQGMGGGESVHDPPPFPQEFESMIHKLSKRVESTDFCGLSDIFQYNVEFSDETLRRLSGNEVDGIGLTHEDMNVRVTVLNGRRPGETEEDRAPQARKNA